MGKQRSGWRLDGAEQPARVTAHASATSRWIVGVVGVLASALVIGACGSSGAGSNGQIGVGEIVATSGPAAFAAPFANAAALSAEYEINAAGGIRGHKVTNVVIDTKSDPADGLIDLNRTLATQSLGMTSGPGSDAAATLVPRLARAHVMTNCYCGSAEFDKTTDPFFWRLLPSDLVSGETMVLYAKQLGYTRIAAVFATDSSAQGSLPGVLTGVRATGAKIVANVGLTPDQTSYRTQVEQVLAAKPQVIVTESDGTTAATFFGELKQLGTPVPVFGTNATLTPDYLKSLTSAVGPAFLKSHFRVEAPAPAKASPGVAAYDDGIRHVASHLPSPAAQFLKSSFIEANYDALISFALAMSASKSTSPSVANNWVIRVTAPAAGKTVVYSYAQGLAALKAGKAIQYIGASGPIRFDQFHNSFGDQAMIAVTPQGQPVASAVIPAPQIQALAAG